MKPTLDFYTYLQTAFDFFNERLFNNKLSPVMFTITRKKRVCGYFRNNAWVSDSGEEIHEIAVNPAYFITASPLEIYQTLCHEMCHQAIFEFGKPSRSGYHNLEWANMMIDIGLMPVAKDGGITGQSVGDKPIPGGKFEQCCIEFFLAGYKLALVDKQYNSNITLNRLNAAIEERIHNASSLAIKIDATTGKGKDVSFNTNDDNSDDASFESPIVSDICSDYDDYNDDEYCPSEVAMTASIGLSNVRNSTFSMSHEFVDDDYDEYEDFDDDNFNSDSEVNYELDAYDAITHPINEFFDISSIKDRPDSPIKTCYQCPSCKFKLWGRKNLEIGCLTCGSELIVIKEGT